MRGVYVGAIPLLAVILLGLLILAPRGKGAPAREKIALAALLALGGTALLVWGIGALAQSLGLGTISPRPFMTRWVNLLIIEPQDNSFPCAEVIVAAILSVGIWAANRWWGIFAIFATLLLMAARLFCGSNYGGDVGVGAVLGIGLMWLCLALCGAPHSKRARIGTGSAGAFTLGATALGTFLVMAAMPRFAGKLQLPWGLPTQASAKVGAAATRAARGTLQEGEGIPAEGMTSASDGAIDADQYAGEAEAEALSKRATQFLPTTEKYLTKVLTPKALPFVLLDVEVAPVTFKNGSYRAAALRFEVDPTIPNARYLVGQRAATLVKSAFAADPKLDNVDVAGVVTGDAAQIDNSLMRFAGDEVPVFTASVQRRNLIVATPKWANDPNLEGGLWLRTRSRLWINDQVLPRLPAAPQLAPVPTTTAPKPTATPNVKTTPTMAPKPTATPSVKVTPKPTAKPTATATQPAPTTKPKATTLPTLKPEPRPIIKPAPKKVLQLRPMLKSA